jgi:2-polyprenyl-3-methyl-5-hydroxy-6-metoxy-1,4-benzoquinol methylase
MNTAEGYFGAIDSPKTDAPYFRQSIPVSGWVYGSGHLQPNRVVASVNGSVIGETSLLYSRDDVAKELGITNDHRTGFRFVSTVTDPAVNGTVVSISIDAEFSNSVHHLGIVKAQIASRDYIDAPYGDLCNPTKLGQLNRSHIYSTGEPAPEASSECVRLLTEYIPTGASVLDVGCGVGAYAGPLSKAGLKWCGCEVNRDHIAAARKRGFEVREIARRWPFSASYRLPAEDQEFDAAIAIEVLEHVREPERFLQEIRRTIRKVALFSVPNMATLPYLSDRLVAPWHVLEGDHRNFFSRFNLSALLKPYFSRVEVIEYGTQPLASAEGIQLPYHLLAVCVR